MVCAKPLSEFSLPSRINEACDAAIRTVLTERRVDRTTLGRTTVALLGTAAVAGTLLVSKYFSSHPDHSVPPGETEGLRSILPNPTSHNAPSTAYNNAQDLTTSPAETTATSGGWTYRSMLPSVGTAAVAAGGLGAAYLAYQNPEMVSGAISAAGETASRYASTIKDASMSGLGTVGSYIPSAETFGTAATTARDTLYSAGSSAWSQASDLASGVASSAAPYVDRARSYLPSSDALPSFSGVMSSVADTAKIATPLIGFGKAVSGVFS